MLPDQAMPEYAEAFKTARRAKNACLFGILLALLLEGTCFVAVRFLDVVDPVYANRSRYLTPQAGKTGKAADKAEADADKAATAATAANAAAAKAAATAAAAKTAADKAAAEATAAKAAADKAVADKVPADKAAAAKAAFVAATAKAATAKVEADKTAADAAAAKAAADKAAAVADANAEAAKTAQAEAEKAGPPAPTTRPAPAIAEPAKDKLNALVWKAVMTWVLHATKVLTPIVTLVLLISIMLSVFMSLLGRLGRISGFVGAFFWTVVLLALVTPWQDILAGRFAGGAMYDLQELTAETGRVLRRWGAPEPMGLDEHLYYARFVGLPAIALLIWLVVALKYAWGCKGIAVPQDESDEDALAGEQESGIDM